MKREKEERTAKNHFKVMRKQTKVDKKRDAKLNEIKEVLDTDDNDIASATGSKKSKIKVGSRENLESQTDIATEVDDEMSPVVVESDDDLG